MRLATAALLFASVVVFGWAGYLIATWPPPPASVEQPESLWLGDSYTAGWGAPSQSQAESCLTAAAMGWACSVDAQGGTGFVNDGHANSEDFAPLGERLAQDTARYSPDVVVVDMGRNDGKFPRSQVEAAAARDLGTIHEAWPNAELVVIAPYFMNGGSLGPDFAAFLERQVDQYDGALVDPVAEGWIGPDTAGMTIPDHVHPSPSGHRYISRHLAEDFKRLGLDDLA